MGDESKNVQPEDVKAAVDELRVKFENYGKESNDYKEAVDRVSATLEANEKKSASIVSELTEEKKKAIELKERIESLELVVAKSAQRGIGSYKDTPEYKSLMKAMRFGHEELALEERKVLRMDSGPTGGYLTTTEMDSVMLKEIIEISPVRQVSRVKTVSKKTFEMAVRTTIPEAFYEGEAEEGQDSQSVYANEQMTAYRLTNTVGYTADQLGDSEFPLEAEINSDNALAFAQKEGNKFVLGTGSKQPEGFLVNASIVAGAVDTIGSGVVEGNDLLLLTGQLKVGQNPMFAFNRQTLAFLRTLQGSDGHYIWQSSLGPSAPNLIAGDPYILMQDMPSIAVGALPIIYADFMRGYTVIDRTGMTVIRDDYSQKRKAIIEMTFYRYNTGQVVLPEAFVALKIKA